MLMPGPADSMAMGIVCEMHPFVIVLSSSGSSLVRFPINTSHTPKVPALCTPV